MVSGKQLLRLALLFQDGSMLILPASTRLDTAIEEAADHDRGDEPSTQIVRVNILSLSSTVP